jgi:hypothetical protein
VNHDQAVHGRQMSLIYDSSSSIEKLLDQGFEMPIHFAAVGTNGAAVTGTYRFSSNSCELDCQIRSQTPEPEGMTAPVNIMFVDSNGQSALVVLRPTGQREPR